jgi:hypothetical protein
MKYTISFKRTLSKLSVLSLAVFSVFSVACDSTNSSNNSAQQPSNAQGTPAPSKSQSGTTNLAATPSTNSTEANSTKPTIAIIEVPSKGAGDKELQTIAGTVGGVKINECKVVIFAHTDTWWVQPYFTSPDTSINEDNTWRNDTHLGSQYAALLVKNSYQPPKTTEKLPDVRDAVLAIVIVNARQ